MATVTLVTFVTLLLYSVFERGLQGLQIGILNHPVTVKITELWPVDVKTVKFKTFLILKGFLTVVT